MVANANPHFLLFCDAQCSPYQSSPESDSGELRGKWHFILERLDSVESDLRLEAADTEPVETQERAALLSVVRGLEALEQPSKVTLVTTSRYVSRGLRYGLNSWRDSGYKWERFGVQTPIRNADLWQRIDQALAYHGVQCKLLQGDQSSNPIQQLLYPDPYFRSGSNQQAEPAVATVASQPGDHLHLPTGSGRRRSWLRFRLLPNKLATGWKSWWAGQSRSPAGASG
ncbi:MAG: RNase H family protein [Planctomycetota bacterium]